MSFHSDGLTVQDVDKYIEALLKGTAPPTEDLQKLVVPLVQPQQDEISSYVRRNVFDDEAIVRARVVAGGDGGRATSYVSPAPDVYVTVMSAAFLFLTSD